MNIPLLAKNLVTNAAAGFPSPSQLESERGTTLAMDASELRRLATERPLRTREVHAQNDFYGHAAILKHYTGIRLTTKLKAVIEHGPFFGGFVWDEDVNSPLPALIAFCSERFPFLQKRTQKKLFAIGPMIAYAPHFLSAEALRAEKQRLGRNLLAFPAHSTHRVDAHFDMDDYCSRLTELGNNFQSVRICLYWKDVLRGWDSEFSARGFECVTAGHIFDPMFLPRLKSIIECATFTISNELGTHLGYCVSMGKSHYLAPLIVTRRGQAENVLSEDAPDRSDKPDVVAVKRAFSQWHDVVSQDQKQIVDRYWGVSEKKSPDELRSIFDEAETLYRRHRRPVFRVRDHCAWMVRS